MYQSVAPTRLAAASKAFRGGLAIAVVAVGLGLPTQLMAQDRVAAVDTAVASKAVAVSNVPQNMPREAAHEAIVVPLEEEQGKSSVTGLEPGTLALIGFGLLALAATRRNAR